MQRKIDEAAPGATLPPGRDEYEGPIRISKLLTLQGECGAARARRGPVATVGSPAVALRNPIIEVTVPAGGGESTDADVALKLAGARWAWGRNAAREGCPWRSPSVFSRRERRAATSSVSACRPPAGWRARARG